MTDRETRVYGAAILLSLCAFFLGIGLVLATYARAEEPHQHIGPAGEFYSKWQRPKGEFSGLVHRGASCCSKADCSPVLELDVRNGHLWARVELAPDTWYRVPRSIIESNQPDPRESPDHRAHACVIGGQIACYVEGGGT